MSDTIIWQTNRQPVRWQSATAPGIEYRTVIGGTINVTGGVSQTGGTQLDIDYRNLDLGAISGQSTNGYGALDPAPMLNIGDLPSPAGVIGDPHHLGQPAFMEAKVSASLDGTQCFRARPEDFIAEDPNDTVAASSLQLVPGSVGQGFTITKGLLERCRVGVLLDRAQGDTSGICQVHFGFLGDNGANSLYVVLNTDEGLRVEQTVDGEDQDLFVDPDAYNSDRTSLIEAQPEPGFVTVFVNGNQVQKIAITVDPSNFQMVVNRVHCFDPTKSGTIGILRCTLNDYGRPVDYPDSLPPATTTEGGDSHWTVVGDDSDYLEPDRDLGLNGRKVNLFGPTDTNHMLSYGRHGLDGPVVNGYGDIGFATGQANDDEDVLVARVHPDGLEVDHGDGLAEVIATGDGAGGALSGSFPDPGLNASSVEALILGYLAAGANINLAVVGGDLQISATGLVPTTRTLAGLDLSADRNAASLRTALNLVPGTDVQAFSSVLASLVANGTPGAVGLAVLLGSTNAAVRTTLGLVVGTDVQAFSSELAALAALSGTTFGRGFLTLADHAALITKLALVAADIPTLTAAKISDFDTQVRTSRLDQMATPTANVAMGTKKLTGVGDPTAAQDAATKAYADLLSAPRSVFISGQYSSQVITSGSAGVTSNRLYFVPFWVHETTTFDQIAINHAATVAGATSVARLGIYSSSFALLVDPGTTVDLTTAAGLKPLSISTTLTPGLYWLGAVCQIASGSPTFTTGQPSIGVPSSDQTASGTKFQGSVSGSLPNPGVPGTANATGALVVYLRKA